ncbi:hypothetical protein [Nonlabens spongiae]|nr:hypothetical protein [Nonlabens spongiae]
MKIFTTVLFLALGLQTIHAQNKHKFYNVDGNEITQEQFESQYDRLKNFILDYERSNSSEHRLINYQSEEQLNSSKTSKIYNYLESITGKELDRDKNLLVSYLSATNSKIDGDSKWDVLNQRYNEIIEERGDVIRLWVHSPDLKNLEPFQIKDITWSADKDRMLEKQLFPENVPYGGFLILQPDGKAYVRLHEHSNQDITENVERLLGKK